ncbi:hypothetical protein IT407_01355 [Candidatus Uhrbacteria bacterium]|nr:hypothetical protein [Candidatus Uhrbacteria bacterium]
MERIDSIVSRVIPGLRRDPNTVIGTCMYCDQAVVHAAGDHDAEGRARHDACDRRARSRALAAIEHDELFFGAVTTMSHFPDLKSAVEDLIRAMPDRFDGRDSLGFVTRCEGLVRKASVPELQRAAALSSLRTIRRSFFALAR